MIQWPRFLPLAVCLWIGWIGDSLAQPHEAAVFPGLLAQAGDGQRAVMFVAPTPNFNLTESQSIHPQLLPGFELELTGYLEVVREGGYAITGDAQIQVDDKLIQGQVAQLAAGRHTLRIKYQRKVGPARLQLWWQTDFLPAEPIPGSAFNHPAEPASLRAALHRDQGRLRWEELNCGACHKSDSKLWPAWQGPVLTGVGSRLKPNWLYYWLQNPKHFLTNALMPILLDTSQDRADAAAYLATLKNPGPAALVTASTLNAARVNRGHEIYHNIGCTACHTDEQWALTGLGSKETAEVLAKFLYDPLATNPSGRMPGMSLTLDEAAIIAEYLTQSHNQEFEPAGPPGNIERGKTLVRSSGCLNCHELEDGAKLASTLEAPAFNQLSGDRGCMAGDQRGKAVWYALSGDERQDLMAFMTRPDVSEAPVLDFQRVVKEYQCLNCHAFHAPPKVAFPRPPPPLTEAGEKLRLSWLEKVFISQKRVRPWLALRMPQFNEARMRALIPLFPAQSGATGAEGELFPQATPEQIQHGIRLIGRGEGGLSCINCHDFRGEKSAAEMRGPDMVEMRDRLRADWVRRWLHDPGRHVPGTPMPAFFSEMAAAQAEPMIEQILRTLGDGGDMPNPVGLTDTAQSYHLLVKDTPQVLRCFMPDSSPRSIAVGLMGKQNYCFDAAAACLRYVWRGDFLDMRPLWTDRGGQPPKLLGTKYYVAPDICPLRIRRPDRLPKIKFRGYELIQQMPVFLYEVDGVHVREQITAATEAPGLVRTFEVGPVMDEVWFLTGDPENVTIKCSGGEINRGRVKLPGGPMVKFTITILDKTGYE